MLPLMLFAGLLAGAAWIADRLPSPLPILPARDGPQITDAGSWGYQLQKLSARRIADHIDLLVIDYSKDGSHERAFSKAEIERLRRRSDGTPRLVLAYMSVGEAESYRYYWWPAWRIFAPSWLGRENGEWKGNFPVRFWQSGWQSILMKPRYSLLDRLVETVMPWRKPYIDRLLEAGFDGLYLDRVDVFSEWTDERAKADQAMVALVGDLSAYAKTRRPGFLIVPQNGEELLRFAAYRKAIDGVAKEDLFFGIRRDNSANPKGEVRKSLANLDLAGRDGLPVFLVEYLSSAEKRAAAQQLADSHNFVLHFARRALDRAPK